MDFAKRTADLIRTAALPTHLIGKQGFDHGVFAPIIIVPLKADVPIYQVSCKAS